LTEASAEGVFLGERPLDVFDDWTGPTEGAFLGERPLDVFDDRTGLAALSERSMLLDMKFFGACPAIMAGHLCCSITLLGGSSEG